MQHGFLKIAVATPPITVAGTDRNAEAIIGCIRRAASDGARLVALPELCVTGYSCGDLFRLDALLEATLEALETVRRFTEGSDMLVILGAPLAMQNALYNCAVVLQNGRFLGIVPKTHLPNYGEFYEKRVFTPAPAENSFMPLLGQDAPFGNRLVFRCNEMPALILGIEVCEDIWSPLPPSTQLCAAGATLICNLSASDEAVAKPAQRRMLIRSQSGRQTCAYAYVSAGQGESTGDLVYSGHNMIFENGSLLAEAQPFGAGYAVTEIDLHTLAHERRRLTRKNASAGVTVVPFSLRPIKAALTRRYWQNPFVPEDPAELAERCREVRLIQAHALAQRVRHTGVQSLVLGVSGGVDSTLALLVCRDTLALLDRPVTDILAVTMPCFGTSARTRGNAEKLCEALSLPLRTIDISAAVKQHLSDIGHSQDETDAAYENAQARERTQVLMDLANMHNGIVVGTGDLSELALGFTTYNGDHMSMYGVNADVPKTLIRRMLLQEAADCGGPLAAVLRDIVATPVSPELLPNTDGNITQVTEDIIGPYELHDFFLYHLIRHGQPREKLLRIAVYTFQGVYDEATIAKWYELFCRRFFKNQFKRSCMPDGPRVGNVALSPRGDWRMPSDAVPDAFV